MSELILNASSEKIVVQLAAKLSQSLLLTGADGVGLGEIARYIAELNEVKPDIFLPESDEKVDLEKGSITVDIMRRLYDETKTKTNEKRIIIIDYAERMTHQAQNAFLKLLEEPGENTFFILLSHSSSKLLPTVLSRVEKLELRPISTQQSEALLDRLGILDKTKRSQMLYMASGLPAELTRLAKDDTYFEKRSQQVRDARELITGSLYNKLLVTHKYKDDRSRALGLLSDASNILERTVISNPQAAAIKRIDDFLSAYSRIESNGNIRLSLAKLVL